METELEKWLSRMKERFKEAEQKVADGEGNKCRPWSTCDTVNLKKAVRIIEALTNFYPWASEPLVNKIAAMTDKEVWRNEI